MFLNRPRVAAEAPPPAGFAQLDLVREAIRELYRRLSGETVRRYPASLAPHLIADSYGTDPVLGAQNLAKTIAKHLRMTEVRLIVSFTQSAGHVGEVELGAGPDYFITVDPSYQHQPPDIAAILAHEVMHVFLHRHRIRMPSLIRNEILTDVAAAYLGTGWLLLNAHRPAHRLGYLSPELFGYVLAKRAHVFNEDISANFAPNPLAANAYRLGYAQAHHDFRRPPLRYCTVEDGTRYVRDRDLAAPGSAFEPGYRFEGTDPMRVIFRCPVCENLMRVPVRRTVTVRCGVCRTELACAT